MLKTPLFEKKNVLISGGAGFIGSHLAERLLRDRRVICLDTFQTSSERNIDHLLKNPDFEFLKVDITQPFDLEQFPELARFKIPFQGLQEIYHLAVPTSPKQFDQYKIDTLRANSVGTLQMLELTRQYQSKFVYTSSAVVYGPRRPEHPVFREEEMGLVNQLSPRACYDEGKRFAESIVQTYADVYGLEAKIARVFRTYGPRMRLFDGQMIPDFITNALDGKDLVIYGDESFSTSLCYVSDVVDGLIRLAAAPAGVGPVNLGDDTDVKLVEVAKEIIRLTGSSSKVVFEPPLLFMTSLGLPDLSRAKEALGWLPLMRLEDGLGQTIEYTKANRMLLGY
ncbi:NAD-dependent epimerase/dehydratase family protein [Candidatus Uhrbacteria bacterium]|nr:NAD-dependent epimerase/dehydratase family protein [Candidatus Uhrbacteria bacterium]